MSGALADAVLIRWATADDADAIARVRIDTWARPTAAFSPIRRSTRSRTTRWRHAGAAGSPPPRRSGSPTWPRTLARSSPSSSRGPSAGDAEYRGEIFAIYVLDAHQGRGIGRALTRRAVADLLAQGRRSLLIWVLRDNAKGRGFYESLGGRAVREREDVIYGVPVVEVGYGWQDAAPLARQTRGSRAF